MTTAVAEAPKKTATAAKLALPLKALQRATHLVGPAIERKTTIPILGNVKIEPADDAVEFIATNLDLAIRARVAVTGAKAGEAFLLPALKLESYAKLLEGAEVSLSLAESRATLRCGRSLTKLPLGALANFPSVADAPASPRLRLKQAVLERLLRFVSFAVSNEESRYTLNGALLDVAGETLTMVATDGHRLAVYTVPVETDDEFNFLAPGGFLRALDKTLGADADAIVKIDASDENLFAALADGTGSVLLAHRRLTGQFPQWKAVMPKDATAILSVSAEATTAALRRALSFADEHTSAVKLSVAVDGIKLHSASENSGETDEAIDVIASAPFEAFIIGFNGGYLVDALSRLEGQVELRFNGSNTALLLRAAPHAGEQFEYVVMPMRV